MVVMPARICNRPHFSLKLANYIICKMKFLAVSCHSLSKRTTSNRELSAEPNNLPILSSALPNFSAEVLSNHNWAFNAVRFGIRLNWVK